MLWRAMLRGTAVQLLKNAAGASGLKAYSSGDMPIPSGTMPVIVVYADEEMEGNSGSEPRFRNKGTVTLEIRAEADSSASVEAQLDWLSELARRALLGGHGLDISCTCTQGSANVVAPDWKLLGFGMRVRDGDVNIPDGGDFVAIQSVNADGSFTMTAPWLGTSGTYLLNIGCFVELFEQIVSVKPFAEYKGAQNKKHLASETMEITGHVTEDYDLAPANDLNTMGLYVDTVAPFDPQGDYSETGDEPANLASTIVPPPRTQGPSGRPLIVGSANLTQEPLPPCEPGNDDT